MDLVPGTLVDGKYRVVRPIGRGGMGAVYEVENVRVRKTVAMKVLSASAADDVVKRFEKEAQAAGRIGSEHIVEVHDLGAMPGGEPYMVMEYLEGETLRARLHRERVLSVEASLPFLVQLLEGLSAAHTAGIVHRDLKPENIYLLAQRGGLRDWVKILDFGISKFAAVSEDGMTKTGQVIGTPQYMAPEQIKAPQSVDGRTDLYAVGVIFYQLCTGHIPFKAKTYAELLFKVVYEPIPHPTSHVAGIDDRACQMMLKAMSRDPGERYQTAIEFRDALLDLAAKVGTPIAGDAAGSTRAFLRASGNQMPIAPGVASSLISSSSAGLRGSGRMEVAIPPGFMPSPTPGVMATPGVLGSSSPGWAATSRPDLYPTGSVLGATPHPALGVPYGAMPGSGTSHPSMTQPLYQSSNAAHFLGGQVPTPHPSFVGVPVTTGLSSGSSGAGGRKAAVALGAGIIAVAIGVVGFVVTRPTPTAPPSAAGQGEPLSLAPGARDPALNPVEPAPTPADVPTEPATSAQPASSGGAPPPARSAATPPASSPGRPPTGGSRGPKPKAKDVLGY